MDSWSVLIEGGKGRADDIFSDTEGFIREGEAPKIAVERKDIAPTIAKDILGVRRNFLMVTNFENPRLLNYKTSICARDYENNLDVSWYLTYKMVGREGHKIPVLDREKAPLVEKMFELYASGNYSIDKLVERRFKEGLRTRENHLLKRTVTG